MDVFLALFGKICLLYTLILLGYIAGRYLRIQKESVASLLIYIISPVVVFNGVITTPINAGTISLPLLFFVISCLSASITYYAASIFWHDSTRNILGFLGGSSNSGFFGLPVALALFGNKSIGIVALAVLGTTLYLTTFGFFLAAKSHHTTRESLIKVIKLPVLYAFLFGLLIHGLNLDLGKAYFDIANNFNGAFVVLGMMLIGLGLADIKKFVLDLRFITVSFLAKFLLWPLMVLAIIWADNRSFNIYNDYTDKVILVLAIVPFAANIVSYATILKSHPEKASFAVFLSTIFAMFYIPLMTALFLH